MQSERVGGRGEGACGGSARVALGRALELGLGLGVGPVQLCVQFAAVGIDLANECVDCSGQMAMQVNQS